MLACLSGSVTSFLASHGPVAVFALMLIVYGSTLTTSRFAGCDGAGLRPVIPARSAGYPAAGRAGTVGYLAAAMIGWLSGVDDGRPMLEGHRTLLTHGPERLERFERSFEQRGDSSVLAGRIGPVLRSFLSIPAAMRTPLRRWVLFTLVGSGTWVALAAVGWGAGSGYRRFRSAFDLAGAAIVALVLAPAAAPFIRARRQSRSVSA